MTEENILGDSVGGGWAKLHPDARKDLIFLLDDCWDVPIGGTLTVLSPLVKEGCRILAQDILDSDSTDITEQVQVEAGKLTLSDELIRKIGTACASKDDISEPGMILKIV